MLLERADTARVGVLPWRDSEGSLKDALDVARAQARGDPQLAEANRFILT